LKHIINAKKYIEIYYQDNEIHYRYIQMHWKNVQILWCFKKYIYLRLKIHYYVLIYILIPSKYIIVPSKKLTYFLHILQYHYYTPISFHIRWNYHKTYLFRMFILSLNYFLKLSWRLIILPKCRTLAMTYLLESKMKHIPWIP
jgi:hypothetical protein